jgi:membrane protease subunit HflK
MAWNEPGGPKDNDPWGKPKQEQGPPDLDEVIKNLQKRLSGLFGGKGGGQTSSGDQGGPSLPAGSPIMIAAIGVILVIAYAYTCFYVVAPAERGVELTFGKHTDTTLPGPHWHWLPFQTYELVNVDEIRKEEIGYRTTTRGRSDQPQTTPVPKEALMLTSDENIIDIKFAVQYRVKDAANFLFSVIDPMSTLRQATESAVREVVGKSKMDFVLTEGRGDIANRVAALAQEVLDRYNTGLIVTSVNMQDAQPPAEVQAAFFDAVKAREDEVRFKNEAEAYSNDILPRARGLSARQIEEANAYKEQVIAKSEGEASRFLNILKEYEKAPEVTAQRMYLESMEEILGKNEKVLLDVKSGNNVMFLPLNRSGAATTGQGMMDQSLQDAMRGAVVPNFVEQQGTVEGEPNPRSRERR